MEVRSRRRDIELMPYKGYSQSPTYTEQQHDVRHNQKFRGREDSLIKEDDRAFREADRKIRENDICVKKLMICQKAQSFGIGIRTL